MGRDEREKDRERERKGEIERGDRGEGNMSTIPSLCTHTRTHTLYLPKCSDQSSRHKLARVIEPVAH